jgi:hypothetical protein
LAGAAEIALLLDVSRQRVTQLAAKPSFPAPLDRLSMGAVWRLDDIREFAERTGRPFHLEALPRRAPEEGVCAPSP